MNRRSLLKSLAGLATAPLIVTGVLKASPITYAELNRAYEKALASGPEPGSPIGSYWAFAGEELRKGDVVYWVGPNTVSKYPK